MTNCPECQEELFSPFDKKYAELYGHCWSCDNQDWQNENLPIEVFEAREAAALEALD